MLTKKENMLETIKGGSPDRFVNQYEALAFILENPIQGSPVEPGQTLRDAWGVTYIWPEGMPGEMPVHGDKTVIKDITRWRDYVKAPETEYPDDVWVPFVAQAEAVDRNEQLLTLFVAPGVFELCHHLCEIQNCMLYFLTEPEAMHELIDFIADWEIRLAQQLIKHFKPDALFHHDDWGSQNSTFLSPEMFEEFLLPAYKKIYGFYKDNGVDLIIHHSDSYAASLVPHMIEMGVDVWQGVTTPNNIPDLVKKYGEQITFMGGLDSGIIDKPDWTPELIASEARKMCEACGSMYFIPCSTQGLSISTFPGVYECISDEIDRLSKEKFPISDGR